MAAADEVYKSICGSLDQLVENTKKLDFKGNLNNAGQDSVLHGLISQLVEVSSQLKAALVQVSKDKPTDTHSKVLNDAIDDTRQASLKGKITLNITNEDLKKDLGVEHDNPNGYENINVPKLVQVISQRYKFDLKEEDLSDARRISKSGNIQITFWNLKINSPYYYLCEAMRRKGANSKGEPIYANFSLTTRRSTLLYLSRQAWKKGTIEKFFVNMDGTITVVPKNQSTKLKLTSVQTKETNYVLWTMDERDFRDRFLPLES